MHAYRTREMQQLHLAAWRLWPFTKAARARNLMGKRKLDHHLGATSQM